MKLRGTFLIVSLTLSIITCLLLVTFSTSPVVAAEQTLVKVAVKAAQLEPVETDMHEFMEYVFQPTYKRLKVAMSEAPKDNSGWKAIKADSLILAEGGNLTMMRPPADDNEDWNQLCAEVRDHGKSLYTAARKKDYETAHKSYVMMLKKCNACHDQFAGGEHQLAP